MRPIFAVSVFLAQAHQWDGSHGKAFCPVNTLLVVPKKGWSALGRAGAQLWPPLLPAPRERHESTEGIRPRNTKFKLTTG